jgi:hypothetical protein
MEDFPPIAEPLPKPQNQAQNGRTVWPPSNKPDWKEPPRQEQPSQQRERPKISIFASEPTHPQHPSNQQKRQKLEQRQAAKKENIQQKISNAASSASSKQPLPSETAQGRPGAVELSSKDNQHPKSVTSATTSAPPKQTIVPRPPTQIEQHGNESQASAETYTSEALNTMPPLLSPLPAGLMSPDNPYPASGSFGFSSKQHQDDQISPLESPLEMPAQVSPLPGWCLEKIHQLEVELNRHDTLLAAGRANNPNTVGARHERSRQPDAPGVARKTAKTRPSNSAPAKDLPVDSGGSTSTKAGRKTDALIDKLDSAGPGRDSLIVKLKYGKRNSKAITRLLQMKPARGAKTIPMSAPAASGSEVRKHARLSDDTEQPSKRRSRVAGGDAPTSVPSGAEVKKHARPDDDSEEPSAKRSKVASNVDVQRARTPLTPSARSPAPSVPSIAQKTFSTPKKGDAMKSVAMRRVDSSDGRALTPHGASVSTPASAEKQRIGGSEVKPSEIEALRAAHAKYIAMGKTLKRESDLILKVKEKDPPPVSDEEKRLAAVIAIESALAFMVGFHSMDVSRQMERRLAPAENWSTFFPFLIFVIGLAKAHPELHTLAWLLNAISREALERIYAERLITEPVNSVPSYLKELAKNATARYTAWAAYRMHCRDYPVEFAISVDDVKIVAVNVLTDFCKKMGIAWEKKLEF